MHLIRAFFVAALLFTLGLSTPTSQHDGRDLNEVVLVDGRDTDKRTQYQRDVQAANMVLIGDIVAKTCWDMKTKDDLTEERLAKLTSSDAQLLFGEMNKYLTKHGREDAIIPEFTQEEYEEAVEEVNMAAQQKLEYDGALEVRAEDAHPSALVEARDKQFFWTIFHLAIAAISIILGLG